MNIARGLLIAAMMVPVSCYATTAKRAPLQITVSVAASFRADAEAAYRLINPICGTTLNPELLKRYEPVRARLSALHQRAAETPFQAILADVKQRQETIASEVDCARPKEDPGTADRVTKDLVAAGQVLSRMEQAISSYLSEKD